MFGFGGGKKQHLVGAAEKRLKAQQYKPEGFIKSKREGTESQLVPVIMVYSLAVVFATILTQGVLESGAGIHTGNSQLDRLLFGPGIPHLTATQDIDKVLVIFLRGTAIFLAGGLLPFCTYAWQRLVDRTRTNVYVSCWGVSIGLCLMYYLARDALPEILEKLVGAVL